MEGLIHGGAYFRNFTVYRLNTQNKNNIIIKPFSLLDHVMVRLRCDMRNWNFFIIFFLWPLFGAK